MRVRMDQFWKQIVTPNFPQIKEDPSFEKFLRFFIDFPKEGSVTVAKWNHITSVLGCKELYDEFESVIKQDGFLGLISPYQAYSILENFPSKSLLIRWSITSTNLFTVTHKLGGKINHSRMEVNSEGKPEKTLSQFIKTKFPDFAKVNLRLNEIQTTSLEEYSQSNCVYYCRSLQKDKEEESPKRKKEEEEENETEISEQQKELELDSPSKRKKENELEQKKTNWNKRNQKDF